jgi:hypothetical protein
MGNISNLNRNSFLKGCGKYVFFSPSESKGINSPEITYSTIENASKVIA